MECALNPALKDVPLAVSGNPEKRHGVILAKNELAKKAGIKTGDVIWQAMQKEPRLKCVPPHFSHLKVIGSSMGLCSSISSGVSGAYLRSSARLPMTW